MKLHTKILNWINSKPILPFIITGAASLVYTIQAWDFTHHQNTLLDEGNYLLKGYLFVTGRYIPYQDFGPWTNKMPLAFLVPGYFQKIFGPGLATGRYYALTVAIIIFIAVVFLGFRLGGKWGGVFAAVMLALNPAPIKIYTRVLAEGLVAVLILFSLLLILGRNRPLWQVLLGALIAGLIPMTRVNMSPVLVLILGYIYWEHGIKKGTLSLLISLLPFTAFTLIYWPGIIQIWIKYIPEGLFAFVDNWKLSFGDRIRIRNPNPTVLDRLMAFSQGIRLQFPSILSILISIAYWPKEWRDQAQKRIAIFLAGSFGALFLVHMTVVLFLDFNIHAFFRYICGFNILSILLATATIQNWNFQSPRWKQISLGGGLVLTSLLIGYSVSEQSSVVGEWIKYGLNFNALTFEGGNLTKASWKWWEVIQARFHWDYLVILKVVAVVLPILIISILFLGLILFWKWYQHKGHTRSSTSFFNSILVTYVLIGLLLSPTDILGGGYKFYDCPEENIESYRNSSLLVSKYINNEDQIFWAGKDTQVILLDLVADKDISIYPQQLNAYNSFFLNGNSTALTRAGFWNDTIAQEWIEGSDVLLFEMQAIQGFFSDTYNQLDLSDFEKVEETTDLGCTPNQRLTIFRRK